jgi:hypothetical protein
MRIRLLLFIGLMLGASGVAPPAGAQATTERLVITEEYDYVTGNPCSGEPIHVEGTLTSVLRTTTTPNGNVLTAGHTNVDMTGTGTLTGTTYQIVDIREITTNLDENGVRQSVGAWAYLVVGAGPDNNLLVTNQYHVTVTPDGDVVAEIFNVTTKCVG